MVLVLVINGHEKFNLENVSNIREIFTFMLIIITKDVWNPTLMITVDMSYISQNFTLFSLMLILFSLMCKYFIFSYWRFTNGPLYFVNNSLEQENLVLCISFFPGPKQSQMKLGFFEDYFFAKKSSWSTRTSREEHGGPKEPMWRDLGGRATYARFLLD